MTKTNQANEIIRNHVLLAMGSSMVPLPGADVIALSGIQMDLVRSLCNNYGVEFSQNQVKAAVGVLVGTSVTKFMANRLLKLIPGIGSLAGGLALASMSAASTYALGEVFKAHFESGGTLLNFDLEKIKKNYTEMFSKGFDMSSSQNIEVKPSKSESYAFATSADIVSRLKDLATMRDNGTITAAEFQQLKQRIVDGF